MLEVASVIPTQNRVRNPDKVKKYIKKFEKGLVLRTNKRKIKIFEICEPKLVNAKEVYSYYCHDGHHRMLAASIAGVTHLYPGEYIIEQMTYDKMMEINLSVGWVTPFDPRTQVRVPDLSEWKDYCEDIKSDTETIRCILGNKICYTEKRKVYSFGDMHDQI